MPKASVKEGGSIVSGKKHRVGWRHLHPKYFPTWLSIFGLTILWLLPRRFKDWFAQKLARWYVNRKSNHRFYAQVNLKLCFSEMTESQRHSLLMKHFRCFFQVMLDAPLFWWGSDKMINKRVDVRGFDAADELITKGQSVVFLVSHSTALDVCTTVFAMRYQMQGFYKPFKDPVIDWLIFKMRSKRGGRLAARGEGFRTVIRDLSKGMPLFYLSDEDLGREGSVFAPFFGVDRATLAMLPRIVKITEAVVFPVYTHYNFTEGRYVITVLDQLQNYPTGNAIADATRLNRATEETIMICPEQYLWKLRLFKTTEQQSDLTPYQKARKSGH